MYPPKQCHSVSIRDSSESRVLRPSLQIVAIAGLAVAFFLFLFTLQFDGAQLDISHDDIQMFGPRPYFLDFIDRGLKDVYNETLGVCFLAEIEKVPLKKLMLRVVWKSLHRWRTHSI